MRELAAAYARALPGLDTHSLLSGLDATLSFLPMGERDGAYDPEHRVVLINSRVRPERQRFTLAHEISHALLLEDDDLLSDLHDAYEGDRLEQVIETLCNVGAAAILMPEALIDEVLARFGPSGRALAELARRADVSASSALYALAERTRAPVLYAVCAVARPDADPDDDAPAGKRLTVRASSGAPGVKYSLRPGTPIPDDHPVAVALATRLPLAQESYVPFRSGRRMPAYVDVFPERQRALVSFALISRAGKGAEADTDAS
ncbi:ImmA/IrrE family metallo-endopeptidase [Deinococcus budaensis]|uniref:Zn-dependent peptidase ImmA (M78 family) n=1 Tax=Deinococcus budaensis TaxID=1665626 RepID=A0A7W8LS63_9DEIO|nr:ImmA/IrrE family metallo-endopeptidase [Deinococcus budaensis]MBB5236302.1 Zn-dependent peptidase ImmA (M78 family) [Deinococcus budaensis]